MKTTVHGPLEFDVLAEGVGFPEGPVISADGTVHVVDIDGGVVWRLDRRRPDRGGPAGCRSERHGARDGDHRHRGQQRRLPLDRSARDAHPDRPCHPHQRAPRLQRWLGRAGRPRARHRRGVAPGVRRSSAARAERPGVRRGRRALVHRPRQGSARKCRPGWSVLRTARRFQRDREGVPSPRTQRGRAFPGRPPGLRGRNAHRAAVGLEPGRAGRDPTGRRATWPYAMEGSAWPPPRSPSTRWPSKPTGGSSSAPSPTGSSSSLPTVRRSTCIRSRAT